MSPLLRDIATPLKAKKIFLAPEEFLTTQELMSLFKVKHKQTIYTLIEEGLPALRVGQTYRFIKAEVIIFLKRRSNHWNRKGKKRVG